MVTTQPGGFKVPFGQSADGAIVPVAQADRDVRYVCPACATPLLLRAGQVRQKHFAHRAQANCSPESALHQATKLRIAEAVTAWRNGTGNRPVVRRRCDHCGGAVDSPISERIVAAKVECRAPGGRIVDVGLLDDSGTLRLAIEVLVTHAVDEQKETALGGLAWIELPADHVEDPAIWAPRRVGGRVNPVRCQACEERPLRRRAATAALAAKYGLEPPARGYYALEADCWRCHKQTVLFLWPGIGFRHNAPAPYPRTVKFRFSKTVSESYLANGCVHCDASQGEFFLEGLFFQAARDDPDAQDLWTVFFAPSDELEWRQSNEATVDLFMDRMFGG